jgi:sirohydrochlorin ferrochelatase
VVVQPHLLFAGALVDRIATAVARLAGEYPETQWLVSAHLGPSELVADAIVDRARRVLGRPATSSGQACTA